jgi:hypothetical protein
MVAGAPRLPASPPMWPSIDVSDNGGGCSWTPRTTSQGPRHQRLRQWWWALLDPQHHLLGGPPSTSPTMVVGAPKPPPLPPRGSPSTSLTMVVGAPRPPASPPRGPTIDIYDIDESTLNHLCSIYLARMHQHEYITNMTASHGIECVTSCS